MYVFNEEIPSRTKYNELREIVGWGALDNESVEKSLPRSVYAVTARFNGEIIGFARVIGDGSLCFYIQEIIVHPEHQKRGIANTFMKYIIEYLNKNAIKRSYIGVFAGKGLEKFYKKYGFWERPTNEMGPGMMQFWDDAEFNKHFNSAQP
jgi:GNAT superfamily N-acetyltransferase